MLGILWFSLEIHKLKAGLDSSLLSLEKVILKGFFNSSAPETGEERNLCGVSSLYLTKPAVKLLQSASETSQRNWYNYPFLLLVRECQSFCLWLHGEILFWPQLAESQHFALRWNSAEAAVHEPALFNGLWYRGGTTVFWQLSDCDGEEKKSGGGEGRRRWEWEWEWGLGGCGRAGIWAAQCHTGEDCRENTRGWGRLEGQGYQRGCEDREGQASCLNHNRMDKPSKEDR